MSARPVPFVWQRPIFWGDTDAARIVYTGKFTDYMFEAIEAWMRAYLDTDWFIQTVDEHRGGPIAKLDFEFFSPLTPRDTLDLSVYLDRIGSSSVTFRVEGHADQGERHCFTGRCVTVGFDYEKGAAMAISPERRAIMEAYREACEVEVTPRSGTE